MKLQRLCITSVTILWTGLVSSVFAGRLNENTVNKREGINQRRAQTVDVNAQTNTVIYIGGDCFSSHATAEVEGRGVVAMSDIQVGDKVLTRKATYETIYTVDHRHPTKSANFVQIHSEMQNDPIEMTARHMIFLEGNSNPVPASSIKVGDQLQTLEGPVTVTKIDTVTRDGVFNPLTVDGTIVVNGIIASSYSSVFADSAWVEIAGVKIMPFQDFFHRLTKPYRYLCTGVSLELCKTDRERTMFSHYGFQFLTFWLEQNDMVQIASLLMILLLVCLADLIISQYGLVLGATLGFVHYSMQTSGKNRSLR